MSMDDDVKIKVRVSTNKVGSNDYTVIEIDRETWESMADDEREEMAREAMFEMIEWNWEEV